jgi:hypothetical protein
MTGYPIRPLVAALSMVVAAPAAAQDVLQYRAEAIEDQQPGVSVVALDPVSVGAIVKDAPYTAEAITDVTQTLPDGNRIERRTSTIIARSSSGATRREQQGFALGGFVAQNAQPIVTITDPQSGVHITLNYELKVAFRMKPWAGTRVEGGVAWEAPLGSRNQGVMVAGRPAAVRGMRVPPPLPPDGVDPPMIAAAPFEAAVVAPPPGEMKHETLEARTIEGLRAEGTRTTLTIPAGAVGNQAPIEVINERWFSPELQVVLMTRRYDPRFGETVYRLTNITRAEPAPELFKVPADFRVEGARH